jgi:hypothetical protein
MQALAASCEELRARTGYPPLDCNNQCRHALNPSAKIGRIIYTATQKNTAIFQLRKFKTNFARTGWASGDIPHIPPSPTSNPYINPLFQLWLRPKFVLNFRN